MNEPTPFTQPAFTQEGRKGIAYDWQSLCDPETLATLQELDRELDLELAAIAAAE
jgi:hypothetical protein